MDQKAKRCIIPQVPQISRTGQRDTQKTINQEPINFELMMGEKDTQSSFVLRRKSPKIDGNGGVHFAGDSSRGDAFLSSAISEIGVLTSFSMITPISANA